MKKLILYLTFWGCIAFFSEDIFGQDKWWQREIPQPTEGQIVNPNYLAKKRELEIALDDLNNTLKQKKYYSNLGQDTKEFDRWMQHLGKKMNLLEYELSKIPQYITKPTPTSSYQPSNIDNKVNVTIEQQKSTDKSSAEILNSGGGNLKSKIQLDELNAYINQKELTIDQKITYYKALILDWPNTAASKEAEIIITDLKLEKIEIEKEKDRTIFKGNYQLEAKNKAFMVDATTASKTFVNPDNPNINVSFFVPVPTKFEKRFQLDNYTKPSEGYTKSGEIFNYLQEQYYGTFNISYKGITKNISVYGRDFDELRLNHWEFKDIDHWVVFSNHLEKNINIDNINIKFSIVTRSSILDLSRWDNNTGRWDPSTFQVYEVEGSDLIVIVYEIKRTDI